MDRKLAVKWLILLTMIVTSLAVVYPPFDVKDAAGKTVKAGKLKGGLDIVGGASFLVQIDRDEVRRDLQAATPAMSEAELDQTVARKAHDAREIAVEAIRNRVDGLGIAEPQIYPQGEDRVVVQMPGVDAAKRENARKAVQSAAFLDFRLVHRSSDRWVKRLMDENKAPRGYRPAGQGPFYVRDRAAVPDEAMDGAFRAELRKFGNHSGAEFMLEKERLADGSEVYRPYFVETTSQLNGKSVTQAMLDYDNAGRPQVALELDTAGRKRFARVTRDYARRGDLNADSDVGRQLAIILDGTLYSAPELLGEIANGRAVITGRFTVEEVKTLVNVLRSGSLQYPMQIVEERTVDPALGRDAVRGGVRAAIIGGVAVVVFMLAYYLLPGLVANLALLLDIILLPLGMLIVAGFMGVLTGGGGGVKPQLPVLTLPGIAGIALTLGMAVDANVLIFERMREEMRAGKKGMAILEGGYEKAFTTIFDSNLTTLLAAVIMFWQGSGPVRGYAITLSAGVLVSMFTAVIVTRMILTHYVNRTGASEFRMFGGFATPNINFMGMRKLATAVSVVLAALSIGVFVMRGQGNLGVDFTGGSSLTFEFVQKKPTADIRAALQTAGVRDANLQYQQVPGKAGTDHEILVVQTTTEGGDKVAETVSTAFSAEGYKMVQRESVGSQVGAELKKKGLVALLWSMIGMVLYITWRFEFGFAMGAIVALLHDALIAVGLFCLLGRQLSTPMIAVVLTIVGYSVNDTIVVFDRIREQMKFNPGKPFIDLANAAINQTLSRTLLTSGTTLLSVLALFLFGGGAINDFALLLLLGITIGTYSSVFIATPITLFWHRDRKSA